MSIEWIALVVCTAAFAAGCATSEYIKSRRRQDTERRQVAAADALVAHRVPRDRVIMHVLGRAGWSEADTATVLRETGGDTKIASAVLTGLTHALSLDHISPIGPRQQRAEIDGVTAWSRLAMHLLDAGVGRKNLATAIEGAINGYSVDLPLRYTAWAYAAGMGREEATARWRTARVNMDEVRRIARDTGVDLSRPHAIAAAAA